MDDSLLMKFKWKSGGLNIKKKRYLKICPQFKIDRTHTSNIVVFAWSARIADAKIRVVVNKLVYLIRIVKKHNAEYEKYYAKTKE